MVEPYSTVLGTWSRLAAPNGNLTLISPPGVLPVPSKVKAPPDSVYLSL